MAGKPSNSELECCYKMQNRIKLIISVALPVMVGGVSGLFTRPEIDGWYKSIQKPDWQPPNWVFGPVWTLLYILMGIALYLVWTSHSSAIQKRKAIFYWSLQLVLNFFWSYIFFSLHRIDLALAEILLLWLFIVVTIFLFARNSKPAAWLLVPYIAWVSFAGILTFTLYQLNK